MTQYSFPWNDVNGDRLYDAEDFMRFFAAFLKTGVVMSFKDGLRVQSAQNGMNIQVGAGSAVIDGGSYLNDEAIAIQVNVASSIQDRVDSVVLRMDKNARATQLFYKPGDTTVARNDTVYELQLVTISVKTNATQITDADITDMRSDPAVCGWSTPFDNINIDGIVDQYKEIFAQADQDFQKWFEDVKGQLSGRINDMEQYIAEGKSNVQILLEDMKNYLDEGKGNFQSWVDSVKGIIESIDPEGKLLAELVDLQQKAEKYLPTGYTFIIEHDSEYQPEVKVTSYKNALGTEVDGFGTGPVFGRERLYNVPTSLSYDRKKIYIEIPKSYTLSGDIVLADDNTLLVINKPQTLCFKITNAKISKGYAG